ncbi:MAG TPA: ATP-binding cassette domain-containing protein, partial [Longimicrobiaceae bacterium]|nr:ATP-binding cassette domain-containing protein [Longimicrobiaceae bacterium]
MNETLPAVLALDGVEKSFGAIRAVAGVSVRVRAGEIVALLGPNGAGKTTLLRLAIGMLHPDRGSVRYRLDGAETGHPVAERVGYLPEERGLYQDVPVRRILRYFGALRGMARADARREADRWLERVGLADRAGEEMRNLSKGNQQKVQFITSIVHRPTLAVLDEPFSGLDPLNQDFFLELIRELRAAGTAVVLSAHHMQLVERLADRVVLLRRGEVAGEGTLDELRRRWGAGRRLRLRLAGEADPALLAGLPGVGAAEARPDGTLEVQLAGD